MPYGVTMFIDKESEQAIRRIWEDISGQGITSYMLDNNVRPHITIAVYNDLDMAAFISRFRDFVKDLSPISFSLSSIGTFLGSEGTVFCAPTVTHRLMNIHSRFHEFFQDMEHSLNEYSLPGRWFPHFTLAVKADRNSVLDIIRTSLDADLPEQSIIEEIGIGEFAFRANRAYTVSWLHSFSL